MSPREWDATTYDLVAAVLRTDGVLEAECGGAGNIAGVLAIVDELGEGVERTWTFATPQDTVRRLEAAGFSHAEAQLVPRPAVIPEAQLERYLSTVVLGDHVGRLGAEAGTRLVAAVAARMPEPVLDYVRLMISARR